MSITTFWVLFLKIIGFWLAINGISGFFIFYAQIYINFGELALAGTAVSFVFAFIVYILIPLILLFKPLMVINLFRLNKNIVQEELNFSGSRTTLLTVAVILFGGYLIIHSLPKLSLLIFNLTEQHIIPDDDRTKQSVFFEIISCFIGYLMIAYSKPIVTYVERKSTDDKTKDKAEDTIDI